MRHYTPQEKYDYRYMTTEIAYDEVQDGFICPFCLNDLHPSLSMMDNTYGGNASPLRIIRKRHTLKVLSKYDCLICDLPLSRCLDG